MAFGWFRKPVSFTDIQVRVLYPPPSLAEAASYGGQSPLSSELRRRVSIITICFMFIF